MTQPRIEWHAVVYTMTESHMCPISAALKINAKWSSYYWMVDESTMMMDRLPRYCVHSLFTSNWCKTNTIGLANVDTNNGPMNERGTTPGNSWWSYWKRSPKIRSHRIGVFSYINKRTSGYACVLCDVSNIKTKTLTAVKFVPWYRMSCIAWILKLSSTFVNGVYNKWTIAMKKTRTPICAAIDNK